MGQKVNPFAYRLGVVNDWKSRWYGGKNYADYLHQDIKIRDLIRGRYTDGGMHDIHIARTAGKTLITIHTSKPGVIVGRSGANIDELRLVLERKFGRGFQIDVAEIRKPDLVATLIAEGISRQIEERTPYRSAVKQAIKRVMESGAEGIRISCGGRLNGADIARVEAFGEGRVPLQTIRADIDFAKGRANTTYGVIGVRVWIYKGDVFGLGTNEAK